MASDTLRRLAADLRKQAAEEAQARTVKCAQVLQAARALAILRGKVKING